MEQWEKEHIEKNLIELIKNTNCNSMLMTKLQSQHVLDKSDIDQLERLNNLEKSKKLYEILKSREGAFNSLMSSLEANKQSGAVKILKNHQVILRTLGQISFDKNRILGKGSAGTIVYDGNFSDTKVAVKVLNAEMIEIDTVLKELMFLKQLDRHKNVVQYFSGEVKDDFIYIALELCLINLQDEIIIKFMNIPPATILKKCTTGLAYLHGLSILHKNLRPTNILINHVGEVKLTDYGLSSRFPEYETSTYFTGSGRVADWMAPEILRSLTKSADSCLHYKTNASADIFSLGCIFYFVISNGRHPFGNPGDRHYNIIHHRPQLKTTLVEDKWIQRIQEMISEKPSQRPSASNILSACFLSKKIGDPGMENLNTSQLGVDFVPKSSPRAVNSYDSKSEKSELTMLFGIKQMSTPSNKMSIVTPQMNSTVSCLTEPARLASSSNTAKLSGKEVAVTMAQATTDFKNKRVNHMVQQDMKHVIQTNLVELIRNTICSIELITLLMAANILSRNDGDYLSELTLTPFEKSKRLYEILLSGNGDSKGVLDAFEKTKQTGVLNILMGHVPKYHQNHRLIQFDKHHVLGRGSPGTVVYKGKFDQRDVAVKVVSCVIIDVEITFREISFLKMLDSHENVTRYYFAEVDDNFIYIALELLEINLQDEIKMRLVNLDPFEILKKCASGLSYLHSLNMIHRDLKPSNILLHRPDKVKLSDFGLSKLIPDEAASVTTSGAAGTADWMAPEVLEALYSEYANKQKSLKMRFSSDIFSLGCIFYYVLSDGQHPFGHLGPIRQVNILKDNLQIKNSMIDDKWLSQIRKMISHSPNERPSAQHILKFFFE